MFFRFVSFGVGLAVFGVLAPVVSPQFLVAGSHHPTPAAVTAPSAETGSGREIALRADPRGHVVVNAVINGLSFEMMVDTGATYVALTEESARRLGIRPAKSDYTVTVSTANGVAAAAPVVLDEIRLGGIRVRNVEATVAPGSTLGVDLLGMSFLNRLTKFELGGGQLVLVQ